MLSDEASDASRKEFGRTSFAPLGTHCKSYNDKGALENFKHNSKINVLMFTFFFLSSYCKEDGFEGNKKRDRELIRRMLW